MLLGFLCVCVCVYVRLASLFYGREHFYLIGWGEKKNKKALFSQSVGRSVGRLCCVLLFTPLQLPRAFSRANSANVFGVTTTTTGYSSIHGEHIVAISPNYSLARWSNPIFVMDASLKRLLSLFFFLVSPSLLLPVIALLAREALEMVDVGPRPHHHLEGRDDFVAGRAVTRRTEQSARNIITFFWALF